MGNCVTVYKNKDPGTDMDLSVQIQSPIKENNVGMEPEYDPRPPDQVSSIEKEASFRDTGKTDESFFDSQPWLDSDCEDFFSVNGDSTSSSGNSPNHQKSFRESSIPDQIHSTNVAEYATIPAQSPTDTKKLLIELFRESINDDDNDDDSSLKQQLESKPSAFNLPQKPSSCETTPYSGYLPREDRPDQSAQCCLPIPNLVRNMSIGERKKRLIPIQN